MAILVEIEEWITVGGTPTFSIIEDYKDLIPCPAGRFDNYTEFTEAVGIEDNYLCIEDGQSINLLGSLNSKNESTVWTFVS